MVPNAGLELQLFFRQFIPALSRDERLEATFQVLYGMNGGMTFSDIQRMRRRDFEWFLKRLVEQKEKENKAMEKATKTGKGTSGRSKYLGR